MTSKIKMRGEVQRYTVHAFNKRFAIMSKPFNARKTYLFSITDLKEGRRGPTNKIFGLDYDVNSKEGAEKLLADLVSGEVEVSHIRRRGKALEPCEIAQLRALKTETVT